MTALQVSYPAKDDGPPSPTELKVLQKYGEFNWLAARTHPDMSYCISVITQGPTKYGSWCLNFCKKVARYLAWTYDQGISFAWVVPCGDRGPYSVERCQHRRL